MVHVLGHLLQRHSTAQHMSSQHELAGNHSQQEHANTLQPLLLVLWKAGEMRLVT